MLPGRRRRTKRSLPGVRSSLMRRALLARSARVGTDCGLKSYSVKSRLWGEKLEVRAAHHFAAGSNGMLHRGTGASGPFCQRFPSFGASSRWLATAPSADFCVAVTVLAGLLSPGTPGTTWAFRGQADRLRRTLVGFATLGALMAVDFVVIGPLGRLGRYCIRSVGSRHCFAFPSNPALG